MAQQKKKEKQSGDLIKCLRCGKTSSVQMVAECKHCGSYAVKLITKNRKQ